MNYPLLAIQPGGFTQLLRSADYWASLPLAFINLYRRRIDVLFFYSKNGGKWRLLSIRPGESIGIFARVFGLWLGLSLRPISVVAEFELSRPYTTEDLKAALRSAVEADDDILCQFHAKEKILAWLDETESVERIFALYGRITRQP